MIRHLALTALALPCLFGFGHERAAPELPAVRPVLIQAGLLLAEPGKRPLKQQTIVVSEGRVTEIFPGYLTSAGSKVPEGADAEVIDLREHFVMPGLMDAHVHLNRRTGAFQPPGFGRKNQDAAAATVSALMAARLNLAAGFTAVRDLGSDDQSVFAARDAIEDGLVLGPSILASGPSVSVTAGHGDRSVSASPDARAAAGICDGADECRTLARHLQKIGADVIKIKVTGGFSSNTGLDQHMQPEEMAAIIEAAHARGIRVAAHGYTPDALKDVIRAGVDSIEHGFLLDDEGLRMMRDSGVFLVPTLTIASPPSIAMRFIPKGETPSSVRIRDEAAAFERAYKLGVKIAFGTDCGIYPHGENADEFLTMVDKGMRPADAILSATRHAAELFDMPDAGFIGPGSRADIIAVRGNPLEDISALQEVDFVLKSGQIAKRDGRMTTAIRFDLEHRY